MADPLARALDPAVGVRQLGTVSQLKVDVGRVRDDRELERDFMARSAPIARRPLPGSNHSIAPVNSARTVSRKARAMSATAGAVASRCRSNAIASSDRLTGTDAIVRA